MLLFQPSFEKRLGSIFNRFKFTINLGSIIIEVIIDLIVHYSMVFIMIIQCSNYEVDCYYYYEKLH